ncbi:MAG: flagellar hook-basal body complex protein, partial [Planktomarina sp.]|nr:flagellar hook-basal body complex protein [Planktomarina sp.]
MSFYTALTGLKGAQTDISTTSNNIANVGSNGFKKSRADFGDIFGSTPMQTKQVGVGTQTKSITQQFGQGNLTTSSNTLDMAVSGQGFFAVQSGGAAPQTVFTRNGAFNVDDTGFIVDSNGQFLLGYPVDDDGAVANKTLAGANKLQLKAEFGAPTATTSMAMGVNLNSKEAVLPATNVFDKDDPTTYSATSSVTIFDAAGVPQSATVFYIKTQDQTDADPTFKYDTKLFVDGLEIIPKLQIAVNSKEEPLYIDKFGQQTAKPAIPDAAYIDEGKGYGLYRADDLGVAIDSTPAMLQGLALPQLLNDGKTITITTDPLEYQSTREYQRSINVANPVGTNFWGKDFMLLDIDASGPRSIDIPPGTYTGTQLAAAVEVATKHAFGDDKKIQLRAGIDNAFSIDLKVTSGDGLAAGLAIPIPVDLHAASIVNTAAEAVAGMSRDNFLSHAQVRVNDSMNAYIHEVGGAGAAGVNVANITAVNADGRLFKKLVSGAIPNTAVPKAGAPVARLSGNDIVKVTQIEGDVGALVTSTRFVAYANDSAGVDFAKPSVAAYDNLEVMSVAQNGGNNTYDKHAVGTTYANKAYFEVPVTNFTTAPEVIRFMQFPDGNAGHINSRVETFFGSKDITVLDTTTVGASAGHYRVTIDFDMTGLTWPITNATSGAERAVQVLAKPSDHIVAYFEDTEGSVEGVKEAHYSNKVVVQEIGASAKRLAAHDSTDNTQTALAYTAFAGGNLASGQALSTLGFNTNTLSTNWVDDRKPAIKVGYDESAQRLTFDSDNAQLGLGTGTGMNSFTVYSKVLTSDTNGVGIPVFGNNKDISLAGDDMVLGESFIATGPDVQPANKRYGMDVYFDTVKNVFEIKSGKTGEAIAANGAVGVTANQTKSDIKLGRYKLTPLGAKDPTDDGIQITNKVGGGTNQIMGFPRDGTDGFFAATGLMSKPAIATGAEALINMEKAFTLTSIANENKFNLVVDGVSAFIELPPANYTGTTLATALEARINVMQHPISGISIGGVDVTYDNVNNNLIFTTGTQGDNSTLKIEGAVRFGLDKVPLGIGKTTDIKTPQQATDANNRPLFVSPNGVITTDTTDFIDNLVEDFYPLYLDDGELTFSKTGALESPITKLTYEGLPNTDITVDFSGATQFATPFKATAVTQDGKGAGRLTGLEI